MNDHAISVYFDLIICCLGWSGAKESGSSTHFGEIVRKSRKTTITVLLYSFVLEIGVILGIRLTLIKTHE